MRSRATRLFAVLLLGVGPFAWAACKKEEPPPTPTASDDDEDEKPKKKKKKAEEEEDDTKVGEPTPGDEGEAGAPTVATGTKPGGTLKPSDAGGAKSDADKAKLIACCTALRNAANAAGVAGSAASAVVPGMPAPPPKEELDKAVKQCDQAVVNWSGDLNESLKGVKGATSVKLPTACYI